VRYLQEAHGLEYGDAVMRSSTVPLGWIIVVRCSGTPLTGLVAGKAGDRCRRDRSRCLPVDPVFPPALLPPYILGLVAGVASGAAMLPYTIVKEVNPPASAARLPESSIV